MATDTLPTAELEARPSTEEVMDYLTYAGNDERKLLTLLAVDDADEPQTKSRLYHTLGEAAGQQIPNGLHLPFQSCRESLAKIDAVETVDDVAVQFGSRHMQATGYVISERGHELGVPFAGALLEWSRRHPGLSLRHILGQTGSNTEARAPLIRYTVLFDLITSDERPQGPSVTFLADHLDISPTTRSSAVQRLIQTGLVEQQSAHNDNQRAFKIVQPDYIAGPRKKAFEKLKPETQTLFKTLRSAFEIKDSWGKDEFLRFATQINPDMDDATVRALNAQIAQALAPSTTFLKGVIEGHGGKSYEGYSRVTLKTEVKDAVMELVGIIDAFCDGNQDVIKAGSQAAAAIMKDPVIFQALYEKGAASSNWATKDEAYIPKFLDIVQSLGTTATTETVRKVYADQTGRVISSGFARSILNGMANDGLLVASPQPLSKVNQRLVTYYSRPSADSNGS